MEESDIIKHVINLTDTKKVLGDKETDRLLLSADDLACLTVCSGMSDLDLFVLQKRRESKKGMYIRGVRHRGRNSLFEVKLTVSTLDKILKKYVEKTSISNIKRKLKKYVEV